jgi:hypothetical protein
MVAAALLLALTIVGVAALVNTAPFDDGRATQAESDAAWEGLEYRDEVATGVGGVVRVVNNDSQFEAYRDLNDSYRRTTRDWVRLSADHYALAGRSAGAEPGRTVNGTRIAQNVTKSFRGPKSRANWTLVTRTNATRNFRITLVNSSLRRDQGFGDSSPEQYRQSRYFRINLTPDGGSTRGIYVYRNATGEEPRVFIRVDRGKATMSERCFATPAPDTGRVTLSVTDNEVGNRPCHQLDIFGELADRNYTISYGRGEQIRGVYDLSVDQNRTRTLEDGAYSTSGRSSPFVERILYGGRVNFSYASPSTMITGSFTATPADESELVRDQARPTGGANVTFFSGTTVQSANVSRTVRTHADGGNEVKGLGPWTTFDTDTDGNNETSFVVAPSGGNSDPVIADSNDGSPVELADLTAYSGDPAAGFGRWNGSGPFMIYVGEGGGTRTFRRANPTSDAEIREEPGDRIKAIGGPANLDSDPGNEIAFVDDSGSNVWYLDDDGGFEELPQTTVGDDGGTPAIGTPADFDGDGTARIPFVNGSSELALVNAETGTVESLSSSVTPAKSPVAAVDWTGDGTTEIVFINQSSGSHTLHFLDGVEDGGTAAVPIRNESLEPVRVDPALGVR